MLQVQNYELKSLSLGEQTEMSVREKVREQTGGWISCGKRTCLFDGSLFYEDASGKRGNRAKILKK